MADGKFLFFLFPAVIIVFGTGVGVGSTYMGRVFSSMVKVLFLFNDLMALGFCLWVLGLPTTKKAGVISKRSNRKPYLEVKLFCFYKIKDMIVVSSEPYFKRSQCSRC